MISGTLQDLRFAWRALLKHRSFTAAALLTLALGIGMNTGIFTLLYSLAFRPLPVNDADRVVSVYQTFSGEFSRQVEGNVELLSYPEYLNYRDRVTGLSGLVASADAGLYLGGDNVEKINGLMVSDNYFLLLGGTSARGRTFFDKECQTPLQCPFAVISYDFWQRRFGGDQNVIGSSLTLNRQNITVIGIAARDFRGTELVVPDVWIPVTMQPALMPDSKLLALPNCSWLSVYGRLKEGFSLPQLQAEMQLVAAQMDHEYPGRKSTVFVMPGSYLNSPEARSTGTPIALLVIAAVALVLLIACANVSNLMLARAAARRKEIAVRLALGASRWRLIRLLLTESLLLAIAGGVAGILLAFWLPPIVLATLPEAGFNIDLRPNATVFAYTLLLSLITGVVFGLAPAIESAKTNLTTSLRSTGNRSGVTRSYLRKVLVIGQVAVSLVLLIGAGLLVRGLQQAQSFDTGFEPKNLLVLSVDLPAKDHEEARAETLYGQLSERLKVLPGIESATLAGVVPFAGTRETSIEIEGRESTGPGLTVSTNTVSANYFETLRIPIRRGRAFSDADAGRDEQLAVISQAMAERFWPGVDPVGRRFKESDGTSREIVAVAGDVSSKRAGQLDGPFFYALASPRKLTGLSFVLRTNGNETASVVRDLARSIDQDAFVKVEPLEENLRRALEPQRLGAWFSGAVSLLALILATTGIYGMLSYHVAERTSEIGIRMALGAQRRNVLRLIVTDGMKLAGVGTVIGLVGAIALTRVLASMLVGVVSTDALTFAFVSIGALAVAFLACFVPARRATKVDPLVTLRNE